MIFLDREDAGTQLAEIIALDESRKQLVLALPRGGIPLGLIIAQYHQLPFDVIMSKKIGHPFHSEYAIGAVPENGEPILNERERSHLDSDWLTKEVSRLRKAMDKRRQMYSKWLDNQSIQGKSVIIVDDGIATGLTMKAAIQAVKEQQAKEISIAVPVIPEDTYRELVKIVDDVMAIDVPKHFLGAVGAYYRFFPQVEDDEIERLLIDYTQT
ncbi:MAG: hypothetical protein JJU16_11090 [Alkalibacterium sp.]|nr:hypothetical protein [Alkalibacterium sp.]